MGKASDICEPRLVSIEQAAAMLGIGRSMAWELVSAGALRTVQIGRRRLVPVAAIDGYVQALMEAQGP